MYIFLCTIKATPLVMWREGTLKLQNKQQLSQKKHSSALTLGYLLHINNDSSKFEYTNTCKIHHDYSQYNIITVKKHIMSIGVLKSLNKLCLYFDRSSKCKNSINL